MAGDERDFPQEFSGIWDQADETFTSDLEYQEFVDRADELFQLAYVDSGYSTEERDTLRADFFAFMEDYGIDIEDFDWDSWRDWYES